MYLMLYDLAAKVAGTVDEMLVTKNPETYVWFALANYMSSKGKEQQDWSTGACRPKGSAKATVTVTQGGWPTQTALGRSA